MAAKFSGVMAAMGLLFVGILLACTPAVARELGSEGNLVEQAIKEVTELIPGDGVGGIVEDKPALKEMLSKCRCSSISLWCCNKQELKEMLSNCACSPFEPWCCNNQELKEMLSTCRCSSITLICCRKQQLKDVLSNCPCSEYTPYCC